MQHESQQKYVTWNIVSFFGAKPAVLQKSNNIQILSKYFWQPMDIIDFRIKEEKYKNCTPWTQNI